MRSQPRDHGQRQVDTEDGPADPVHHRRRLKSQTEYDAVEHQGGLHEEGHRPQGSGTGKRAFPMQAENEKGGCEQLGTVGGIGIRDHESGSVPHRRPEVHLAHEGQIAGQPHEQAHGAHRLKLLREPLAQHPGHLR